MPSDRRAEAERVAHDLAYRNGVCTAQAREAFMCHGTLCQEAVRALLAFPGGDAEPVDPSKLDRVRAEKIMPACEWTPPCDETESRSPCFRCRTVDAIADALALAHSEAAAPVAGEAGKAP